MKMLNVIFTQLIESNKCHLSEIKKDIYQQ
jgi:hypothetical protein